VGCNHFITCHRELTGLLRTGRVVWTQVIYFFVLADSEILLAASGEEDQPDLVIADETYLPVAALLAESMRPEAVSVTDCKIVLPSF